MGTFALWWVTLFGAFLLYQGDVAYLNRLAAAGAAVVAAVFAVAVRGRRDGGARVPPAALKSLPRLPLQVVLDFAIVTRALVRTLAGRRVSGSFVERPPTPAADRPFIGIAAGYSPNAYPVELGEDAPRTVVHDLVRNRRSEEPA